MLSGKTGCTKAKVVVFGQVVVFWQNWLYSGKNGCIRAMWFYLGKVIVIGQSVCFRVKMVVFGKK